MKRVGRQVGTSRKPFFPRMEGGPYARILRVSSRQAVRVRRFLLPRAAIR